MKTINFAILLMVISFTFTNNTSAQYSRWFTGPSEGVGQFSDEVWVSAGFVSYGINATVNGMQPLYGCDFDQNAYVSIMCEDGQGAEAEAYYSGLTGYEESQRFGGMFFLPYDEQVFISGYTNNGGYCTVALDW